jgi:hypothetical protein
MFIGEIMPSVALISGADSNYYPLLREWIHSVRSFKESAAIDLCIIDGGLTSEQLNELRPLVKTIVNPAWPAGIPSRKTKGKDRLKTCVCRPFIREMFPDYDLYMWMDADTWVQDWSGVEMFLVAAGRKADRIVVTNGADRSAPKEFRVKWLWRWPYRVTNFYFNNGRRVLGFSEAKKLCTRFVVNAGCFALSAKAPHWERWQKNVVVAATKGRIFPAEQLALGMTIFLDGYEAEFLPSYAHWLCSTFPCWDEQQRVFVEPFMPHEVLGVLHLCGVDGMRASKMAKGRFETVDGSHVELNLRYPHYDGGELPLAKAKRG